MILQILATLLSLVGAILHGKRTKWSFVFDAFASVAWVGWAFTVTPIVWGQVLVNPIFTVLSVWGFVEWTKAKDKPEESDGE
jgi:hypothetical protein